jgi:hypothetical protein
VQRCAAKIISAVHARAPAQRTGFRAQQASQAGHVTRARGGHEAGAPLRPVVHDQDRGVKVFVAPQRVVKRTVQHRICLHGIALIREQEHNTLNRRPLGHDGEGGVREHSYYASAVLRSNEAGCALPRALARFVQAKSALPELVSVSLGQNGRATLFFLQRACSDPTTSGLPELARR